MKKRLLAAMALLPFVAMAQKPFTLSGEIKGLKTGNKVYFVYQDISDSATVTNGAFTFKGTLSSPTKGELFLNKNPYVNNPEKGEKLDFLSLYVEPANIKLTAADSLKKATITGSAINDEAKKFKALTKPVADKIEALDAEYAAYTPAQEKDEALKNALMARYQKENTVMSGLLLKYVTSNPKSYVGLLEISQLATYHPDQIAVAEKAFNGLSPELKATPTGKNLTQVFEAEKKTAVGVMAMDFTQPDTAGKPVKLSDFKGKYVLLDFWASWCGPCREENPNVVVAYNKFKDKGFTVLGVSLDSKKAKNEWLKAIAADHLTWTQVSDLNDGNNAAAQMYSVLGIPANFLIDPNGKIIAKNLRGQALQDKLQELLGSKSK